MYPSRSPDEEARAEDSLNDLVAETRLDVIISGLASSSA